jgi:hypothetical protein
MLALGFKEGLVVHELAELWALCCHDYLVRVDGLTRRIIIVRDKCEIKVQLRAAQCELGVHAEPAMQACTGMSHMWRTLYLRPLDLRQDILVQDRALVHKRENGGVPPAPGAAAPGVRVHARLLRAASVGMLPAVTLVCAAALRRRHQPIACRVVAGWSTRTRSP